MKFEFSSKTRKLLSITTVLGLILVFWGFFGSSFWAIILLLVGLVTSLVSGLLVLLSRPSPAKITIVDVRNTSLMILIACMVGCLLMLIISFVHMFIFPCGNCYDDVAAIFQDKSVCASQYIGLLDYSERFDDSAQASGDLHVNYSGKVFTCYEGTILSEEDSYCLIGTSADENNCLRISVNNEGCTLSNTKCNF